MQFYKPYFFILLWIVPAAILFYVIALKRKERLKEFFAQRLTLQKISVEYSSKRIIYKIIFVLCAIVFIIVALARPQWGEEKKKIKRKGVDILFMVDTSKSMLAEDFKPNRLEKAKRIITALVERLKGDRIGMVAFAGSSFLECPLTVDYSAFKLFMDSIDVGYIPDDGTALQEAIKTAAGSFQETVAKYNVIIILSDGEDHEGGIDEIGNYLNKNGIRVFCIGVATTQGAPIPERNDRNVVAGYKRDKNGEIVISTLQETVLKKIAKLSNGIYVPATNAEQEVDVISSYIKNLERRELNERLISEREEQFQLFLLIAIILLIADIIISDKRK